MTADTYSLADLKQRLRIPRPGVNPMHFRVGDITMPIGDVLVFMVTVENYSGVPIRTHGGITGHSL